MKSWNEIRKAATAFSKRWKNAYDEKAQAQSFLKEFFAVFGVDAVTVATVEHRVKFTDGSQGYAGTSFVSVYEADSNATYRTEFPFSSYCSYKDCGDYGAVRVAEDDEYLIFRTRIVKDEKGNIVSANYGKIYGGIRTVGFFGASAIYFNPAANDTNLEAK